MRGNYACYNQGAGRFAGPCRLVSKVSTTTISAADFNGDGRVDLAVPHRDGGHSLVHLQGPVGFDDPRTISFGPSNGTVRMAEAGDFDGDGRMDLVAIDEQNGIRIYSGRPGDRFSEGQSLGDDTTVPDALAVTDLNGDGRPDIIVGFVEAPSSVFVNEGQGGRFRRVMFGDDHGTVYGFAAGDLDEDGHLDIVAARSEAPSVLYLAVPPR